MARRRRSGFEKKIQNVHWTVGAFRAQSLAAGATQVLTLAAQHLPETLMRIRGEYACWFEGAQAGNIAAQVVFGLISVPLNTRITPAQLILE